MKSEPLVFPEAILDQHLVVLGKTGAGKSSALRHVVEHLLSKKKRVCIIDPKGDWWGLKVGADGKSAGFPVVLFGDFKNEAARDVPVNDRSGSTIAELIATGNRPCVVGMRGWTHGAMTRFWIDFAAALFARNAGELYLVGDEFHNFAPKQWRGVQDRDNPASVGLHWANRLLSEGRGLGLVCLIASQRPQKVHNDALTSCETLVAMRVVHKADRDAVEDWIRGAGDPALGKEVLNSLASMPRGEAFVWSPEAGFGPERVKFPMFTTFDSFAPPQLQQKVSQEGWAEVDLKEVEERLAAVIEEAKARDPKEWGRERAELRRRITSLEHDLKEAQEAKPRAETKTVEVPVITDEQMKNLRDLFEDVKVYTDRLESCKFAFEKGLGKFLSEIESYRAAINKLPAGSPRHTPAPLREIETRSRAAPPSSQSERKLPRAAAAGGDIKLSNSQQRVLDALAFYESIGIREPTGVQVGAVAMIDPSGGYFGNVVGPLSSAGLVVRLTGKLRLTDAGRARARVPEEVGTLDQYHDVLRARVRRLKNASQRTVDMLDCIIARGGESLTTEEIGLAVGIDPSGGYFGNTIGPLSTVGLIERERGVVRPTAILFPEGLA